jgi:hypothetical protein
VMVFTLRAAVALEALAAVFFFAAMDCLPLFGVFLMLYWFRNGTDNRRCFLVRFAPGLHNTEGA